jgi:hypothetical protein
VFIFPGIVHAKTRKAPSLFRFFRAFRASGGTKTSRFFVLLLILRQVFDDSNRYRIEFLVYLLTIRRTSSTIDLPKSFKNSLLKYIQKRAINSHVSSYQSEQIVYIKNLILKNVLGSNAAIPGHCSHSYLYDIDTFDRIARTPYLSFSISSERNLRKQIE